MKTQKRKWVTPKLMSLLSRETEAGSPIASSTEGFHFTSSTINSHPSS